MCLYTLYMALSASVMRVTIRSAMPLDFEYTIFAFQGEYPGVLDKTVGRVDCKLMSANRFRLCFTPAQQKEDSELSFQAKFRRKAPKSQEICRNADPRLLDNTICF